MPEDKKNTHGTDAVYMVYRLVMLVGAKIALIIFGVVLLLALIILITLPLSANKELSDNLKDEVAIDYVKTGDYFNYDWELLIVKDATLHKNDVSKTNPLDSLMDMTTLTETIKTVIKQKKGKTKTIYKEYTYTGKQIFSKVKDYYGQNREISYIPESFGPALLDLPQSYEVISRTATTTTYRKFSIKYLNKDEIIEKYFKNDKETAGQFEFVYNSHFIADYIFVCDSASASKANIEGSKNWGDVVLEKQTPVKYYCQTDTRWCNTAYGDSTIGRAGCGPTALSIVISSLKSTTVEPPTVSNWAYQNGYKAKKGGSYRSLMVAGAKNWGVNVKSGVSSPEEIRKALASGKLLIAIMGPGEFTRGGHYIVLRGITKEGKILVADPNSYSRSNKEYDLSLILRQTKAGLWIYS